VQQFRSNVGSTYMAGYNLIPSCVADLWIADLHRLLALLPNDRWLALFAGPMSLPGGIASCPR
jgi:hypothetical protein